MPPQPGPGGPQGFPIPPRPRPIPPRPRPIPPRPLPPWPYPGWPQGYPLPPYPYPIPPRPIPPLPYPGPIGQPAVQELLLTVTRTVGPQSGTRSVRLGCSPPRGTHPRAFEACAELTPAQGNPAAVAPIIGVFCSQLYEPVRATANGVWNGRYIRFDRTYSNPCMMHNATRDVFSF
ncbi:SSI family serine proteinase inhibitor [Streptosporangium sp. NPDC087985]|uniref:SSI family serine proteinase inhibitor n=1 Tax=Streptosporangium sp. NPDC087985 TaxID=3366196 RepID=UPI00382A5477